MKTFKDYVINESSDNWLNVLTTDLVATADTVSKAIEKMVRIRYTSNKVLDELSTFHKLFYKSFNKYKDMLLSYKDENKFLGRIEIIAELNNKVRTVIEFNSENIIFSVQPSNNRVREFNKASDAIKYIEETL